MAQAINTNLASLNAQRSANRVQGELATTVARLSSGLRINSARDDAAGLAISERFSAQVRGIDQAVRNANDGSHSEAHEAIAALDRALGTVNTRQASLGTLQNRFASALGNLQSSGENLSAARSRIRDADFAQETANLSRAQVLQSAGTAMMAQANQTPGQVLALLR